MHVQNVDTFSPIFMKSFVTILF